MKKDNGKFISVRGARVHNLKNISVDIPRDKLVVITGVSGSGKSSLAFDTIYAEGQRRYVESLSAYARQFLGVMEKPDVESIEGLSPAISIDQKSVSSNPRSTVGTITEIYDYLRLLFARIGKPHCPKCGRIVKKQSVSGMAGAVLRMAQNSRIIVLAPLIRDKKGEHRQIFETIEKAGYARVRVDGDIMPIEEALELNLDKNKKHSIEVAVDRLVIDKDLERSRLVDSLETALKLGDGLIIVASEDKKKEDLIFSEKFSCEHCLVNLPSIEPRTFSFNSPHGACPRCTGLGTTLEVDPELVIPNKRLTVAEGAVRPWQAASHRLGRQGWYWMALEDLSRRIGFSLDAPVKDLPQKIIDIILYGDGHFEGVAGNLLRRHKETDSPATREEIEKYMMIKDCPSCLGRRLRPEALAVLVFGKSIDDISRLPISEVADFFRQKLSLAGSDGKIAAPIVKEILARLKFLTDVGLDYLTLDRSATTISGGEAQRIRLATQIGSGLTGVLYVLDEPSIGLHPRDQRRLIETLFNLRRLGNTVIVVEHDEQTIRASDWIIDIGPGAGDQGGNIMFAGPFGKILASKTMTGDYLSGKLKAALFKKPRLPGKKFLTVRGASEHNLKNISVKFPLGLFIAVTGVSGSGKSTLVSDILSRALAQKFYRSKERPGRHEKIEGDENIDKVITIDQSPIGRTPRSNPATYTGVFTPIRTLFASVREARVRGYKEGRFSFNVKGGRCESCEGQGYKKIEMYFLPDMYVECEECRGSRYNKEALEIEYRGKNIAQVLAMSVEEAFQFFKEIPSLKHKLQTLREVGLGYMKLGQPATTLSGGEAQRIKLATELSRKGTGQTLYILDEPTTGLHFDDVRKLLLVLDQLAERGNTVLVVEHNPDVIASSDWVIDLGPEGGEKGGEIVAEGSPAEIAANKKSRTGRFLKEGLG